MTDPASIVPAARGASHVIETVLLAGMVVVSAVFVAQAGAGILDQTRDRSDRQAATSALFEVDNRLTSLSRHPSHSRTTLSIDESRVSGLSVRDGGSITVSIDNGTSQATAPLTAIVYQASDGDTVAYQAGGVWEVVDDRAHMVTPPDLTHRNRTVQIALSTVSGTIDGPRVPVHRLSDSGADTQAFNNRLFNRTECQRPDSVTIAIESEYARAWGRYLEDEFGGGGRSEATVTDRTDTARITIDGRGLPRAADDDRNLVADFEDGYGRYHDGRLSVDKDSPGNHYPVSIRLLSGSRQGGRPHVGISRSRRALDVALTVDESGSMAGAKLAGTREAATAFVGRLHTTGSDRVSLVGYSDTGPCVPIFFLDLCPPRYPDLARVHAGLSHDGDAINESLETDLRADGYTPIAAGLNRTTDHLVASGREPSERVAVLLSDGEHNGDGNVSAAARRAAENGVTVYTVGFGVNEEGEQYLRTIANLTGGSYYYAANATELGRQFDDIAVGVTKSHTVRSDPATIVAGGSTLLPNGSDRSVPPNATGHDIADPRLEQSPGWMTTLSDGRSFPITITRWDCREWRPTNRTVAGPDGLTYLEAHCAAAGSREDVVGAGAAPHRLVAFSAAATTTDLPDGTASWTERSLTEILQSAGLVNATGGLDLASNQIVIAADFLETDESVGDFNDVVLLVEVGYASEDAAATYAVSVTVTDVRVGAERREES